MHYLKICPQEDVQLTQKHTNEQRFLIWRQQRRLSNVNQSIVKSICVMTQKDAFFRKLIHFDNEFRNMNILPTMYQKAYQLQFISERDIIKMHIEESLPKDRLPECSICLEPCLKPVQCKGPCRNTFCLKCASRARDLDRRCPNRCSNPFKVKFMPAPLVCPYSPSTCTVPIRKKNALDYHYGICPFLSEEKREAIKHANNYQCSQGHKLTFMPQKALQNFYGKHLYNHVLSEEAVRTCAECKASKFCRTICLECSLQKQLTVYCIDCRIPPSSKKQCPLGHPLEHRSKNKSNKVCDYCEVDANLMGPKLHGFCGCDFDLCDGCYKSLPASREQTLTYDLSKEWVFLLFREGEDADNDWQA